MKTRIGTLLTVLLACFALTATACDKKDGDKGKDDNAKKVDGKDLAKAAKAVTAAKGAAVVAANGATAAKGATAVAAKAAGEVDAATLKAMHSLADKLVVKGKDICACKDEACAKKEMTGLSALMRDGGKLFGKKMPPQEIRTKVEPAMKAAGECMKKFAKKK